MPPRTPRSSSTGRGSCFPALAPAAGGGGAGASDAELILAVPRARLPGGVPWRGVRRDDLEPHLEAIAAAGVFRPRGELEPDPAWKQVIPYLVLRDGPRVFLMRRTRAGGDARLHDRWSIGIEI